MNCTCKTKWTANHDTVKPISLLFDKCLDAIQELTDDKENSDTREKAHGLLHAVCESRSNVTISTDKIFIH